MRLNKEGTTLLYLYSLEFDLAESKNDATKAVSLLVPCRLNNNQFSALVCLVCGISIDTFKKSALRKLLNRDNKLTAAEAFTNFAYVTDDAGQLILDANKLKHRELQKDLFLTPELVRKSKRNVSREPKWIK